ncbi:uncharacterized protein LOC113561686 [Ooceraea biroi]|uniref:uncharacterized protein LOC113561686 n=1 Tax=Ooceraea biroi TaxID=2015173 RepID=UPI000F099649|nr:uncharacterized protein LOC113561686 [Ooceraea biroi]
MCGDTLIASLLAATWPDRSPVEDVEEEASWLRGIVTDACDASMPRAGRPPGRRAAYWWSGEIAELRRSSVRARRRFLRARRSGIAARIDNAYGEYRTARYSLRQAISRAKDGAWDDLLRSINKDPWGRRYKLVMGKLRPWAPPITESLPPQVREAIIDALFPAGEGVPPLTEDRPREHEANEVPEVTPEEMAGCQKGLRGNKAPGPDGIPGKAWVQALEVCSRT